MRQCSLRTSSMVISGEAWAFRHCHGMLIMLCTASIPKSVKKKKTGRKTKTGTLINLLMEGRDGKRQDENAYPPHILISLLDKTKQGKPPASHRLLAHAAHLTFRLPFSLPWETGPDGGLVGGACVWPMWPGVWPSTAHLPVVIIQKKRWATYLPVLHLPPRLALACLPTMPCGIDLCTHFVLHLPDCSPSYPYSHLFFSCTLHCFSPLALPP